MNGIAMTVLACVIALILIRGILGGADLYACMLEGAREGMRTGVSILPALMAMGFMLQAMQASGLSALLASALSPLLRLLRIPQEAASLFVLRPMTGSGSLAALRQIIEAYGADSREARVAAGLMGSSETLFYTITVYLGATRIKRLKGLIPVALLSYLCGAAAAGLLTK